MKLIFGGGKAEYWGVGSAGLHTSKGWTIVWHYWLPEHKVIRSCEDPYRWLPKNGNACFDIPTPPEVIKEAGRAWKAVLKHNHFVEMAESYYRGFSINPHWKYENDFNPDYVPFYNELTRGEFWEEGEKHQTLSVLCGCMTDQGDPDAEYLRAWVDYYWAPGYEERVLVPHLPPPYLE